MNTPTPDEVTPASADTPDAEPTIQPESSTTLTEVPAAQASSAKAAAARPMSQAECLSKLTAQFPVLFTGPVKPLKLRIQTDIQERAPGVFTKQDLSAFFRRYTGATAYLVAVSKSQHRFDLDGQPAGELTAEHRQVALDELKQRRAVQQTRRDQEEAEFRQRSKMLSDLLRDYETTRLTEANFCALKGIAPDALAGMLAQAKQEAQARPPMRSGRDNRDDRAGHFRRDNAGRADGRTNGGANVGSNGKQDQRPRR